MRPDAPSPQPGGRRVRRPDGVRRVARWSAAPSFLPGRPPRSDVVGALVLFAAALVLQARVPAPDGIPAWLTGLTPAGVAVLAAQVLPYAWRSTAPVPVLAVTVPPLLLVGPVTGDGLPAQLLAGVLTLVVQYSVAARRPPRVSVPVYVAVGVLGLVLDPPAAADLVAAVAVYGGLWLVGFAVWRRRRIREEALRRRVDAVRERIARELHDVVAHQVTGMVVQAAAARAGSAVRPDDARRALADIAGTGRDALAALRRMLAVLRRQARDDPAGADGTGPTTRVDRAGVVRDVGVALVPAALFAFGGSLTDERDTGLTPAVAAFAELSAPQALMIAVLLGALLWRRRRPALALLVVTTAAIGYDRLDGPQVFGNTAIVIALYAAAAYLPWRRALLAVLLSLTALVVAQAAGLPAAPDRAVVYVLTPFLVVVAALARWRRRHTRRRQSDQQERAVEAERVRISRELHDVVAHHLTGIVVQASAVEMQPAATPEDLATAVERVEGGGREALVGLRQLMDVLSAPAAERGAHLAPQPGLADLELLVDGVGRSGSPVDLRTERVDDVDAQTGLFAYRIVQEALTNCVKHAGGAPVEVRVLADGAELVIEVCNASAPRTVRLVPSGGRGLIGMRERVELLGGWLGVGPTDDGGWAVRARLPRAAPGAGPRDEERRWASAS